MIRFFHAHFPIRTVLLGLSDICLVTLAFCLATIARLGATDATFMLAYEQGLVKIAVVSLAFITCMYCFDLYDLSVLSNRREMLTRIVQVLGTACILLALLYYIDPRLELGRGIFVGGAILLTVLLYLGRRLFLSVNRLPQFAAKTMILGDGPLAQSLRHELLSRSELGVCLIDGNEASRAHKGNVDRQSEDGLSERVNEDDLVSTAKTLRVNRIVVAMSDRRGKLPLESLLALKSSGVRIQDGTDMYEAITGKVPIESLRLGWLLFSPGFRVSRWHLIYKRVASICVSSIGLILSVPLLPIVALAVKLSSPGPLFYRQKRVGLGGKVFSCYKVRTMRADAEADSGPTWAKDDDPRITPVGRLLRASRIDEIPQLWNVLRSDMHLVGPRPERPEFVEWLDQQIPHYQLRHAVRPGITGWAQVRYRYANSVDDAKEKLRFDLFYVKNMSPGLDVLIFFETIKTILIGRGAK